MARMSLLGKFLGLSLLSVSLTGCVAAEKYNALRMAHEAAVSQAAQADSEARAANAKAAALQQQNDSLMQGINNNDQTGLLTNLTAQVSSLQRENDGLRRELTDAAQWAGQVNVAPLPEDLDNALTQFARQNPDVVDYDSNRGVVKFRSDLTFALGSAELTPGAAAAINSFSRILTSPAAAGYELQVAGHTDSTSVQRAATIRAGHKDNWYLSSHRAISVSTALQKQGVRPERIAVVGYADKRPIAANDSEAGRAQNRRVEIFVGERPRG